MIVSALRCTARMAAFNFAAPMLGVKGLVMPAYPAGTSGWCKMMWGMLLSMGQSGELLQCCISLALRMSMCLILVQALGYSHCLLQGDSGWEQFVQTYVRRLKSNLPMVCYCATAFYIWLPISRLYELSIESIPLSSSPATRCILADMHSSWTLLAFVSDKTLCEKVWSSSSTSIYCYHCWLEDQILIVDQPTMVRLHDCEYCAGPGLQQ